MMRGQFSCHWVFSPLHTCCCESLAFHLIFHRFSPFNSCLSVVLLLGKGDYPENLRRLFCPNTQRSLCLDRALTVSFSYAQYYWRPAKLVLASGRITYKSLGPDHLPKCADLAPLSQPRLSWHAPARSTCPKGGKSDYPQVLWSVVCP